MNDYLEHIYWGNKLLTWIITLGCIISAVGVIRILVYTGLKKISIWAQKTETTWDDFLVRTIKRSVVPLLYMVSIYLSLSILVLPSIISKTLHAILLIVLTFYTLRIISSAFKKSVNSYIERRSAAGGKEQQARGMIIIVNIIIWILGIIFLMDNLGYNVTTLVAGLGIGGIAIALAAQAILGDLFSYFVIFFDRPFEIGDFIVVDDKSGTIEHIGIKTTRIRTLGGEQLICANTGLTNARLHNYKRLEKRRVLFTLGVTYQTTQAQLRCIPELVRRIIQERTEVQFDRGHFSGYADSCLNFEFVYYILNSDYTVYMDKRQDIYLDIFRVFSEENIEFAYPTQTIFIDATKANELASTP